MKDNTNRDSIKNLFHASELLWKPHHKREIWLAHKQMTVYVCKIKFAFLKVAIMEIVNFRAQPDPTTGALRTNVAHFGTAGFM